MKPELCPHCGSEVPPDAPACPGCGADERTGWSDSATANRLAIPDPEGFDYERFVEEEFGPRKPARRWRWVWILIGVLALAAVLWRRMF